MDNKLKELADLMFPNVTKTIEDYEMMYPKRNLKEELNNVLFSSEKCR